jgi:hypothetical protein
MEPEVELPPPVADEPSVQDNLTDEYWALYTVYNDDAS